MNVYPIPFRSYAYLYEEILLLNGKLVPLQLISVNERTFVLVLVYLLFIRMINVQKSYVCGLNSESSRTFFFWPKEEQNTERERRDAKEKIQQNSVCVFLFLFFPDI